jgi:hypothetical protein
MLDFKKWYENEFVYRIDKDPIKDFSSSLKTYYRSPDWGSSGTFGSEEKIPSDWQKETGLFAGNLKQVIPYATPRDTKWLVTYEDPKRPTVIFNQRDRGNILSYRPHLSKFSASKFIKVPSGEFFSTDPKAALKQEIVRNPLKFMKKWYNVLFVPDLEQTAKDLRSKNIHFDSEGLQF